MPRKVAEIAVISLRGLLFTGSIVHRGEAGMRGEVVHRGEVINRGNIARRTQVGGYESAMATHSEISDRIVCDTFLRYKGLERPAIIITDLQHEVEKYNVRMNIAISRAFGVLRVVGARGEMEKDEILKRVAEIDEA